MQSHGLNQRTERLLCRIIKPGVNEDKPVAWCEFYRFTKAHETLGVSPRPLGTNLVLALNATCLGQGLGFWDLWFRTRVSHYSFFDDRIIV